MADEKDLVPLTQAISGLRRQLMDAAKRAQGLGPNEPRFRVKDVELELSVVAEDTATGGGEVGWWIFKAKAEASAKNAVTQKVKLTLDVGDIPVSGEKTG